MNLRNVKAIILAGGFGTRLRGAVLDVPKPLAPIAGKPFLEYQINYLKNQGIYRIALAIHYLPDKFKEYFGDGSNFNIDLDYSQEKTPLGTGGGIKQAALNEKNDFFILNGDSYSEPNLSEMFDFHKSKKSLATLCVARENQTSELGCLVLNERKEITKFSEKRNIGTNLINAGIYLFNPEVLNFIADNKPTSIEHEIFPRLAETNRFFGFLYDGYFIDIGNPRTYYEFERFIKLKEAAL